MNADFESRTSASLLSDLRHGDRAALARFHEKYAPRMYGWCRRLWNLNHHDAEDVTADLTVKLMGYFTRFPYDSTKSFRAWLRVVVKRAVADFWRKRSRAKMASDVPLEQLTSGEDLAQRVEDELAWLEACERVQAACNPQHWRMFSMVTAEGLDPNEVARRLNVSRNVVDNAKLRIKKALIQEVQALDSVS